MVDGSPAQSPRHTGRGIVVYDNKILLMERWRDNLHYFSIPGGGIEVGETASQAAEREITEETSIGAKAQRLVIEMHDGATIHRLFLCEYLSGEPHLPDGAEEAQKGPRNRFSPTWIPIESLPDLPFLYWQPVKEPLVAGLRNGFPTAPIIVSAILAR